MFHHFVGLALRGLKPLLTHFSPVLHKDTKLKSLASLQCRRKSRGIHPHRDWEKTWSKSTPIATSNSEYVQIRKLIQQAFAATTQSYKC